jgi:N-formylglutamate deformylase
MNLRSSPTHTLLPGSTPLIISVPHAGTALPPEVAAQLTPPARALPDTDWHVAQLYDFAGAMGATVLVARYSRYVVDLNRPPDDAALYSDQAQTGLCPLLSFSGESLYLDAEAALAENEVQRRRQRYWQPYHDVLRALVNETRARFGYALLIDAHSIRSVVPRLFAGTLPAINIGSYDARSCDPQLLATVRARLDSQRDWSHVIDGRFKGGYITRHYGRPEHRAHALQIELTQASYLQEPAAGSAAPPRYASEQAAALRELLAALLADLLTVPLATA